METIAIIPLTATDIPALQTIGRNTFFETFAKDNSAQNMSQYLDEKFSLQQLTAEYNTPGTSFYLAQLNNQIIGYLKLNTGAAQTESQSNDALEIERIYVLGAFHGKKVGQLLYEKAIEIALQHQAPYVWLGVWEENHRAIGFYKKNGFVPFDTHIFHLGDEAQTDIMMKKTLG